MIPATKPGGNPGWEVARLRNRVAELEAENARLSALADSTPTPTRKSRLRGTGEAETPSLPSLWERCGGVEARCRAESPAYAVAADAFAAVSVLLRGTPTYEAPRRKMLALLYGTTVESRARKMAGMFVRTVEGRA